MASDTITGRTDIILHQYDISPFARRVKMALAIKGVPWCACTPPVIAPKPDLVALTGGYRKIPVLQIGADIYCDSRLALDLLDRLFPDPPLGGADGGAMAFLLDDWASRQMIEQCVPMLYGAGGTAPDAAFAKDREEVMGGPFVDLDRWRARAPHAAETMRAELARLEMTLADGRSWLAGTAPGLMDIFSYPNLGFLTDVQADWRGILDALPRTCAWMDRAAALGDGVRTDIEAADALAIARDADPRHAGGIEPGEPNGLTQGMAVVVRAVDYGRDPVAGTLHAASARSITILREDDRAGRIAVHFPRAGFDVTPA